VAVALKSFDKRRQAAVALAGALRRLLEDRIAATGRASLVVSGGSTPAGLFRELAQGGLPWEQITVLASDERDVPPEHPDRNEAMIRRELLQGPAARASLVSLRPPGDIPDRFDAVVLGMGADGHTASLFPGSPELDRALESAEPLLHMTVPQLDARRITLTPSALLSGGPVFLLIFGDDKRNVLEQALAGDDAREFPVRAVLHQDRAPVTVYWAP
jgi:6-phosphogluconolactonase